MKKSFPPKEIPFINSLPFANPIFDKALSDRSDTSLYLTCFFLLFNTCILCYFQYYQTIDFIIRHWKSQEGFPDFICHFQIYSKYTERLFLKILCKPVFYTSKNVDNVDNLVDNFIL